MPWFSSPSLISYPEATHAQSAVLSLQSSNVRNMFGEAEHAQDDSNQSDGLDLDISQTCQALSEARCPRILPGQEVVRQHVLRLGLDLLEAQQHNVRTGAAQQRPETEVSVREHGGNIPGYQLDTHTLHPSLESKLP